MAAHEPFAEPGEEERVKRNTATEPNLMVDPNDQEGFLALSPFRPKRHININIDLPTWIKEKIVLAKDAGDEGYFKKDRTA